VNFDEPDKCIKLYKHNFSPLIGLSSEDIALFRCYQMD